MTEGQRHLCEVYEQVKDLLEETPPEVWDAYCSPSEQAETGSRIAN